VEIDLAEKGKRIELGTACIAVPAVDADDTENRINEGMDAKGVCPSMFSMTMGQIELSSRAARSKRGTVCRFRLPANSRINAKAKHRPMQATTKPPRGKRKEETRSREPSFSRSLLQFSSIDFKEKPLSRDSHLSLRLLSNCQCQPVYPAHSHFHDIPYPSISCIFSSLRRTHRHIVLCLPPRRPSLRARRCRRIMPWTRSMQLWLLPTRVRVMTAWLLVRLIRLDPRARLTTVDHGRRCG
jgi:hypothetical protein